MADQNTAVLALAPPPDTLGDADFEAMRTAANESKAKGDKVNAFLSSDKVSKPERDAYYAYVNKQTSAAQPPRASTSVLGVPVSVVGEHPRIDTNIVGTASGAGIAPEDVLMGGMAAKGVVGAVRGATGIVPKAVAGISNVVSQTAPVVKYEVTRHALQATGMPPSLAAVLAMGVSGYKSKGKVEPATPAAVSAGPPRLVKTGAGSGGAGGAQPFEQHLANALATEPSDIPSSVSGQPGPTMTPQGRPSWPPPGGEPPLSPAQNAMPAPAPLSSNPELNEALKRGIEQDAIRNAALRGTEADVAHSPIARATEVARTHATPRAPNGTILQPIKSQLEAALAHELAKRGR